MKKTIQIKMLIGIIAILLISIIVLGIDSKKINTILSGMIQSFAGEKEEDNIEMKQEIEKYFVTEDSTILQQKIELTEKKTQAKQESQKVEINIPEMQEEIPNSVTILKNGEKIDESKYVINQDSKKIEINSQEQENTTYKIIYKYSKLDRVEQTIELNTRVSYKLEDQDESGFADSKSVNLQEYIGSNISYIENYKSDIYKGNLYEKKNETGYMQNYNLEISDANDIEKIHIKEESNEKTYYKQTLLNKDNLINILGEDFEIHIKKDENEEITTLNKDTEVDENGNIKIEYENVKQIEMDITKPTNSGELKIRNSKAIQSDTGLSREQIKNWNVIEEKITINESEFKSSNELKETTTQAKLEINKTNWTTMSKNENIEIGVTLESNNNTQDLYKNPTVKLELPKDIEDIEINNISKLYGDEFEIVKAYNAEENGRKYIFLQLNGEQLEYKEKAIDGTKIVVNANITLNKKMTNKKDTIKLIYTNEQANGYANENGEITQEIDIISPKEIITVNKISELGIETIGDEEIVSKEISRGDKKKTINVESQIISNYDSKIKNVSVIGNFATDGKVMIGDEEKQNNLGITLTSEISVLGNENKDIQIYYTENSNPSNDLSDKNNQWTNDLSSIKNPRKYLVTINELNKDDIITLKYEEEIPGNLKYNQQAFHGYNILYTKEDTQELGSAKATTININSGRGPVIEAKISANVNNKAVNNGDVLKAGEEINYEITLENVGTEQAKDVKVTMSVPENTRIKNNESNEKTIEAINAGESKVVSFTVRINDDISSETNIIAKAQIEYNGLTIKTEECSNKAIPASIVGEIKCISDIKSFSEGDVIQYKLYIENKTDEEQKNLTLNWNLPDYAKITSQGLIDDTTGFAGKLFSNDKAINLPDLPAKSKIGIILEVKLENVKESEVLSISADIKQGDETFRIGKTEELTVFCTNNFEIKMSANKENEYVKPGDEIDYKVEIINNNDPDAYVDKTYPISIKDNIPNELNVLGILVNNEEYKQEDTTDTNKVFAVINSKPGETTTVVIKTVVNYAEYDENRKITNKATMVSVNGTEFETNEVSHTIEFENKNNSGNNNGNNNGNSEDSKYEISGKVWVDKNRDGEMGDNETTLQGIKAMLLNLTTNDYATDKSGNIIQALTNSNGEYTLSNISKGEYLVVFEYDSSKYTLTNYQKEGVPSNRSSKVIAKKISLGELEKYYAVTDTIKVSDRSIGNINMGLVEAEKFDLKLDKYINKVIVQTSKGSSVYSYDKAQLAKVELDSKKLSNVNVVVEYKIVLSNVGEIDGYVKKVADYLPDGFVFSSNENSGWNKQGNDLYNSSLANEKIPVGQTKELTLKVSRKINANEVGTYTNVAEIVDGYNEKGITDINSTPGNKVKGENDMSQAELIISIKTGKVLLYITMILVLIITIGIGIYEIKVKVLNKEERR